MNIPIASPSRELQLINNFHERFNSLLNDGIYIGGSSVTDFENREITYGKDDFKNPSLILKSKNLIYG